jgi:membrane fusion protein, multidrug efflux system
MKGVTLAPNPAIQLGASGNFVYLLNDDATVSKRDVAIGPTDGKHTVVTSGLKAGDKVVIDGVDRLRDGAKVKVVDQAAAGGGQAGAGAGLGSDNEGSAAAPAQGAGQHHHRRHDQSGATENSAPPATQTNPDATARGPAQVEAAPSASTPSGTPAGPTGQGSAK